MPVSQMSVMYVSWCFFVFSATLRAMTGKTTDVTGEGQPDSKPQPGPSHLRHRLGSIFLGRRVEMGLTQVEVAALVGVHRTYVNKVEKGQVNISLDNLEKFQKVLLPDGDSTPLRVRFANNLKLLRAERFSQETLAFHLGVPDRTISRIETASVSTSIDVVENFAFKLGLDPMQLLK